MQFFFSQLRVFLEKEVAPIANELDEDASLFEQIYHRFVALGGLKLLLPRALGGLGGERKEWIEYNILMAQYSGALLFLQAQHQFSIARLKELLPDQKVTEVLQSFAREDRGMGLALSKNKNLLTVQATSTGFLLSGVLRWCTGKNYFSHLLLSFEQENVLFYTLLPFEERAGKAGFISIGPKIETAVFNAVPSNSITLENYLVTNNAIIASHPVHPFLPREHPSAYNFAGVAKALFKIILQSKYGGTTEVREKQRRLEQDWERYYSKLKEGHFNPYRLRCEGLQLVEASILLARTACASAGILRSHPLGRLIRESWQYTVAGYSEEQVKAYLEV